MKKILTILLPMLLLIALAGCKAKERIIYQHHTDSIYVAHTDTFVREVVRHTTDTLTLRDSVFIERISTITLNEGGDTIYVDKVVYRDRWRDKVQVGTADVSQSVKDKQQSQAAQIRTDTIFVQQQTGTQAKKASVWERIGKGAVVIFAILLLLALLRYKKYI